MVVSSVTKIQISTHIGICNYLPKHITLLNILHSSERKGRHLPNVHAQVPCVEEARAEPLNITHVLNPLQAKSLIQPHSMSFEQAAFAARSVV